MIKPINTHYSMENPASVYDEEALTALELAGRTTAKLNEVIKEFNTLVEDTQRQLDQMNESIPGTVAQDVQKHINIGIFDQQIGEYIGNLDERVNNLVANGNENSAEVLDMRVDRLGITYGSAGESLRCGLMDSISTSSGVVKFYRGTIDSGSGDFVETLNRCVSNLIEPKQIGFIKAYNGYRFRVFFINSDQDIDGYSGWCTEYLFDDIENGHSQYARIVVAKDTDENIDANEANSAISAITKDSGFMVDHYTPFMYGTVTTDGEVVHRSNRLVSPLMKAPEIIVPCTGMSAWALVAMYDADLNFLGCTDFKYKHFTRWNDYNDAEYVRIVVRITDNPDIEYSPLYSYVNVYHSTTPTMLNEWDKGAPALLHETMNIAYSDVNLAPINTRLHYRCAAHMGFNALKGDVQRTANGVLIMSHDPGFTRHGDTSELEEFDSTNYTPWSEYEWITDPAVSEGQLGYDNDVGYTEGLVGVPELHQYIRVCRETNTIAYITLREDSSIVEAVLNTVKEFGMLERCVINSYTYQTLEMVRKFSRTIPVSLVLDKGTPLNMNHITKVKNLGNGIITLFYYPSTESVTGVSLLKSTGDLIKTAINEGVVVHMAQLNSTSDYQRCIQFGISGAHITRCVLPHTPKMYTFEVEITQGTCNVGGSWNLQDITSATVGGIGDYQGVYYVNITNTVLRQLLDKNFTYVGVHCPENPQAVAYYKEGAIHIDTQDVDAWYRIIIIV